MKNTKICNIFVQGDETISGKTSQNTHFAKFFLEAANGRPSALLRRRVGEGYLEAAPAPFLSLASNRTNKKAFDAVVLRNCDGVTTRA